MTSKMILKDGTLNTEATAPTGNSPKRPTRAITPTRENKKLTTRSNADISGELEDAFDSTVEVVKLDGSKTTLAAATPKAPRTTQPVPKSQSTGKTPRGAGQAAVAARVAAGAAAALESPSAILEDARKRAAQAKVDIANAEKERKANERIASKAEAKAKVDAEKAAAKKERDDKAAAAKKERDDKKEAAKKEREEKKAAAAAAKKLAVGETGDPVSDAAFHAAVDEARALAIQPADVQALDLPFLNRPGVKLSAKGLTLPTGVPLGEWVNTIASLKGLGDLSNFAIGDALAYGADTYGKQYAVACEALNMGRSTIKNAVMVARAYPIEDRVIGASFSHHLAATALYKRSPAVALNLLQEAATDRQPESWLRAQIAEINAQENGLPSAAKQAQDKRDALVTAATAQRDADLADFANPAALDKAVREEVNAVLDYAQRNLEVPSEAVVRNIARLQTQIDNAQADVQIWKERALRAEAQVVALGGEVAVHATPTLTPYQGGNLTEATDVTMGSLADDEDTLAFLTEATDVDEPIEG